MTSRSSALRRRLEEAEAAAHELWLARAYGELRELLANQPMETTRAVLGTLRAFSEGLATWPASTTFPDIEAGWLATVEKAAPVLGRELRQRLEAPPLTRPL